jgi:hypothetical protein
LEVVEEAHFSEVEETPFAGVVEAVVFLEVVYSLKMVGSGEKGSEMVESEGRS